MIIYNARTQQKFLTFFAGGAFSLGFLITLFVSKLYKSTRDTIIIASIIVGILFLSFIVYFLLIKFANSVFIFDENGFVRKINNKVVLKVTWENVISIGTYQIYDFFKIEFGPTFLSVDYYDENHNEQCLAVAFSAKEAKKLKESGLNEKLNNIIPTDTVDTILEAYDDSFCEPEFDNPDSSTLYLDSFFSDNLEFIDKDEGTKTDT